MFGHAYCQSVNFGVRHVSLGHCIWIFGGRCKPRPGDHETSQALDSRPRVDEDAVLSRNDSIGSVVLAAFSSARASLLARYGPSIGPRLALASSCERIRDAIPFLPTESFRPARTIQLDRLCWLRLHPQELRCSLVTGLPSARASLSPRLAKEFATPSLSSQLNRSGLAGGLRLTLGVDRDLLFRSRDPVTPLPSLLGTDDTSVARGRCGWKTGIGIQCESKVESIQL